MTAGRKPALEIAARALAMRPMTRKMLLEKLAEKEYGEDEAALAADAMEELGALDDADYARVFALDREARGWGVVRIKQELLRRGVERETVEEATGELEDPTETIEAFISAKARGTALDRKTADKIAAALIRKGFKWDQIRPVLDEYRE